MTSILQINSGLSGALSQSSALADATVVAIMETNPGSRLVKRDLSVEPIPHIDLETFSAFSDPDVSSAPAGLALSNNLIAELETVDTLVLGVPMYNLSVPSTLKAWLDHVTRAGRTFQYTENGPIGLLSGIRAVVCAAQGGNFLHTSTDTMLPFLKNSLALIGISEVEFVTAQGLAYGPEAAAAAMEAAHQHIAEVACLPSLSEAI